MAWHSSTNNTLATFSLNLYQLLATLLAAGWTKVSDSDGTTYSATGVQITGGNTGANGLNNSYAWFVVRSPAGVGHSSFCFQNGTGVGGGTDASWRVKYSPIAGFIGGTPGATITPSATDEYILNGGGTDTAPSFATWFYGAEGSTRYNAMAQDVAPYCFWGQGWPVGGGTPFGGIFYDGVINGAASPVDDSDPHVVNLDNSDQGWSSNAVSSSSYNYAVKPYVGGAPVLVNGVAFPWTTPNSGCMPDPTNGKDMVRPLEYFFAGGYYKGQTQNILWEMTSTASNSRPLGFLLTLVTASDHIVVGQLVLPWDGSTPLV